MPDTLHILLLADEWLRATGLAETTLSNRIFGESKKISLIRGGGGLTVERYRHSVLWFSSTWPEGAEWPDAIARPAEAV